MQLMMFQFLQGEANFQNYREQDVKKFAATRLFNKPLIAP